MKQEPSGPGGPETARREELMGVLREVRAVLSRVYHDANNPLAIISGNAQFMLELSKAMELDDDLIQPVQDIEEASRRVAEALRELVPLREAVAQCLTRADTP